jgi:rare lipoprotein A
VRSHIGGWLESKEVSRDLSRDISRDISRDLHGVHGVLVKATYYAKGFEGRKMANGQVFRHSKFSAASNRFPLGTFVRVACCKTNRAIVVEVTDRPAAGARNLDLSRAAFTALGLTEKSGWGMVTVSPIYPVSVDSKL